MRFRSTIFALAATAWSGVGRARVGDHRMRRLFRRPAHRGERHAGRIRTRDRRLPDALRLERVRRDDKGRRRRDALSCRGDEFLRFEARIGEPANARTNTNFERFQTAALKAALGWDAGKSRGVLRGMTAGRARISRRLARARRRLRRRQDRGARTGRREPRADGDRLGSHLRHRRPGGRVSEVRFHHLERRRVDEALPRILERALDDGRRVVVRASSERDGGGAQRAIVDL